MSENTIQHTVKLQTVGKRIYTGQKVFTQTSSVANIGYGGEIIGKIDFGKIHIKGNIFLERPEIKNPRG